MDNKEPQVEPEDPKKNDKKKKILLLLLLLLLLLGGIYIGLNWNNWFGDRPTVNIDANAQNQRNKKKQNSSATKIPGFETMTMKANTTEQSVNLYNPKGNKVYFRLSIYLSNGKKIWQSEMIKPGKAIYKLKLNRTLAVGTYENCTLRYDCYAMSKQLVQLNGSQMNFTLKVVE